MSAKFIEFLSQFEASDPALIESIRRGYAAIVEANYTQYAKSSREREFNRAIEIALDRLNEGLSQGGATNLMEKVDGLAKIIGDEFRIEGQISPEFARSIKSAMSVLHDRLADYPRMTADRKAAIEDNIRWVNSSLTAASLV